MNSAILSVTLPVLPIKRTVLFPGILIPVTVGRERSVAAVNAALKTEEKMILVVAQRDPGKKIQASKTSTRSERKPSSNRSDAPRTVPFRRSSKARTSRST